MKICIPTETDRGMDARVYGHFGSAPYFTVYDTDSDSIEVIDNSKNHHIHGRCHPLSKLSDMGLSAVICFGMGVRALQALKANGIKVYRQNGRTVHELVENFMNNNVQELTEEESCNQHSCH